MAIPQDRQSTDKPLNRKLRLRSIAVFIFIVLGIILLSDQTFILGSWMAIQWMHWVIIVIALFFIALGITIWTTSSKDANQGTWSISPSARPIVVTFGVALIMGGTVVALVNDITTIRGPWVPIISTLCNTLGLLCAVVSLPFSTPVSLPPSSQPTPSSELGSSMPQQQAEASTLSDSVDRPSLSQTSLVDKTYNIQGGLPPTNPPLIQQREKVVKEVYTKLIQPNVTAIALTGSADIGKSTLAALIYQYAETERQAGRGAFKTKGLWLNIRPNVTLADVLYTLFTDQAPALPELTPDNQSKVLQEALNTGEARLVVLNQFETLLDKKTDFVLPGQPGIDEWLNGLNSKPCKSRVLLTAYPSLLRDLPYAPVHLQEQEVPGLELNEGVDFMQKLGVQRKAEEMLEIVKRYEGHPHILLLAANYLKMNPGLRITNFLNDFKTGSQFYHNYFAPTIGDLDVVEQKLLLAFSVYREGVPLKAIERFFSPEVPASKIRKAQQTLLERRLLQDFGEDPYHVREHLYQVYPVVADYILFHLTEGDPQSSQKNLAAAHTKAAEYYLEQAARSPKKLQSNYIPSFKEAIWHLCQANQYQKAYSLTRREAIFENLSKWKDKKSLLELCELFLSSETWHPSSSQAISMQTYEEAAYSELERD